MHEKLLASSRKKAIFGAIIAGLVVVAIFAGIHVLNRTPSQQSSNNIVVPEEADMNIELKVGDWLAMPDNAVNLPESPNTATDDSQQGATNTANSNVELRVNGVPVETPANGSVQKQIITEDGSTRVNFWSQSNTSSNESDGQASINVDIDSSIKVRNESSK